MRKQGWYWVKVNTPECEWQPALFQGGGKWWVEEGRMEDASDNELAVIGPHIPEPACEGEVLAVFTSRATGGTQTFSCSGGQQSPEKAASARDAKQATKELIELMKGLSPDERLEVFSDIEDVYCQHCGDEQQKGSQPCQCWNDE